MNTDRIGALVTALPWAIAGSLLLAVLWAATHREPSHREPPHRPPSHAASPAHDADQKPAADRR